MLIVRALYWLRSLHEDPMDLFTELGVKSDDRLLEIGCAIGYHTLALAELAQEGMVYAVDIWEEGLRFLRSRTKSRRNIALICCSAEDVKIPLGSLDKVFCFDTLHELADPQGALRRWAGFLKEGGRLYFKDPEIPPEQVERWSEGELEEVERVLGIPVFAPWKARRRAIEIPYKRRREVNQ